jgi:mRNA interferase RelE/StbE
VSDSYQVIFQPAVQRDLKSISRDDVNRILRRTEALAHNPRPAGSLKVGDPSMYRVRQGDYRIIYQVDDAQRVVLILRIGHRREVYR